MRLPRHKSLNRMKLTLKKHNKKYEEDIRKYREVAVAVVKIADIITPLESLRTHKVASLKVMTLMNLMTLMTLMALMTLTLIHPTLRATMMTIATKTRMTRARYVAAHGCLGAIYFCLLGE